MSYKDSDDLFGSIGFGFPLNCGQLDNFDRVHDDFTFEGNENTISPGAILRELAKASSKPSNIDYHKRTVLAAEIVDQLRGERTMGHLKLQKLMYLCQQTICLGLHANFSQQPLGPYDPVLSRSLDKKFSENGWFKFTKDDFPLYKPLDKVGGHRKWYIKYFSGESEAIDQLIEVFRRAKSEKVELVATIFACCLEAIERKEVVTDRLIIERVYAWSEFKIKFSEDQIARALGWMQETGLYPKSK